MIASPANDHSPEPRWRRLPEERPRQILEAACQVFGERGLAAARLEDIAKVAGVSKGTIYLYFPNKESLFTEMIHQTIIANIEQAEIDYATGAPTELLRQYMRKLWTNLRSPVFDTVHRLVMHELHNFPDLCDWYVREVLMRSLRLSAGIVQRGIESGDFRPIDPMVAARMLTAMFVKHAVWGANRACFVHMADVSDEETLTQLMDFYFHAIQSDRVTTSEPDATGAGMHA